jgi:hypothetical protein
MGFWKRVLGLIGPHVPPGPSLHPTPTSPRRSNDAQKFDLGDGVNFEMAIVGESYYGLEIKRIAGDRLANGEEVVFQVTIAREPHNEYDSNAIAVIGSYGKKIGHFSRDYAVEYQQVLQLIEARGMIAVCSARMFGGKGRKKNIGVWLDMEPADVLMARLSSQTDEQPF